uniref:Uncharacterized protein n=1 Tax=Magallana gigas TaxID=29159 RepID=A0A8W8NTQ5_MAGGI
MAAPKKIKLDEQSIEVEGYVHNVSPLKVSRNNNNYFNAIFQEEGKYTDLVCFVQDYNSVLKDIEKTKSPRQLQFRFEEPKLNKTVTIKEARSGLNPFQKITIEAKVMNKMDPTLQAIKSGEVIRKSYITVADATDTIQVCAWDKHIDQLEIGKSYKMTSVSLRSFDGIKSITTCPDTIIDRIEDIESVNTAETDAISVIDTLIIDAVSCNSFTLCSACNKAIGVFNPDVNTVKCPTCQMRQKTKNLHQSFKIQVNCRFQSNDQPKKMAISHNVLTNFRETRELKSDNEIEDYFLSKSNFKVEVTSSQSQILRILEAN